MSIELNANGGVITEAIAAALLNLIPNKDPKCYWEGSWDMGGEIAWIGIDKFCKLTAKILEFKDGPKFLSENSIEENPENSEDNPIFLEYEFRPSETYSLDILDFRSPNGDLLGTIRGLVISLV